MTTDSKAVCGGGEADLLTFLDGLAENAAPDQRKPLNPILIGMNASVHADRIRSAALASTAGAGAGDWLPIETAPKDGTVILCAWPGHGPESKSHIGECVWKKEFYPLGCKAIETWWVLRGGPTSKEPTHWMPRPTAPGQSPAVPASPRSGAGDDLEQATADQIKAGLEVFQVSHPAPAEHGVEIRELHAALSKGHALLCESGPDRCWVKIGFGWLQDAQDAHGALARFIKPAPAQSPSTSDREG